MFLYSPTLSYRYSELHSALTLTTVTHLTVFTKLHPASTLFITFFFGLKFGSFMNSILLFTLNSANSPLSSAYYSHLTTLIRVLSAFCPGLISTS